MEKRRPNERQFPFLGSNRNHNIIDSIEPPALCGGSLSQSLTVPLSLLSLKFLIGFFSCSEVQKRVKCPRRRGNGGEFLATFLMRVIRTGCLTLVRVHVHAHVSSDLLSLCAVTGERKKMRA